MKPVRISKWLFFLIACVSLNVNASPVHATPRVIDVSLALDVVDREPQGILDPPGSCSGTEPETLPTIDSKVHRKIVLWTRVSSSEQSVLLHSWQKDGIKISEQRTLTPWRDKAIQFLEFVQVSLGWKEIAGVEVRLGKGNSWRTWSSKAIDRHVHVGKWKVIVTPTTDRENVLCTVHFEII